MRITALVLALLIGCSDKSGVPVSGDDTGTDDGGDGGDGGEDSGPTGTDADGDGFTVEDGDCDDDDIAVNPAREEDTFDGIDNDCDGRIDEEWSGLSMVEQVEGGRSKILVLDTIARIVDEVALPDDMVPYSIDHGVDDGWVLVTNEIFINISAGTPAFEYAPADIIEVNADGDVQVIATFVDEAYEANDFENMKAYWFGPIVRAVRAHPGGYYIAATPGALWKVERDGTTTELASWEWDLADPDTYQLFAQDISIDLLTGEVGILDLLGGFATWNETEGLQIHKQADLSDNWENWDAKLGVGVSRMDSDGWFAMVADFTTGEYALNRFDEEGLDWELRMEWANNLVRPLGLATDGDHGEFYVTAKGGDYRTMWRIREEGELIDDAMTETDDGYSYWGIVSNY